MAYRKNVSRVSANKFHVESNLEMLEHVRAMFTDAAQRAAVPLPANDIDSLAQRISFSLHVQPSATSNLGEITSQIALRPSSIMATELAKRVRYILNVGDVDPLFHLPALISDQLNVLVFPIEQNNIAGGCAMIANRSFVFVSQANEVEALFTCAHELAHLALMSRRSGNATAATLDPAGSLTPSIRSPYEHFADAFALELLIPLRGLGIALKQIRKLLKVSDAPIGDIELLYLSRIFGVTFLAIAKRCERARLLPKGGATSLHDFLINKFGGSESRAEGLGLPPRQIVKIAQIPRSIELATIDRVQKGEVSREQASRALSWLGINIPQPNQLGGH